MSSRTAERNKGVARAWKREKELVLEGKGTRDWTPEQQRQIIEKGKAYNQENRSYYVHHMKSVAEYPEYAADVNNMQILSYEEHYEGAHGGNTHIPTNGYYDPRTGKTTDFGDEPPIPVSIIELSNPIIKSKIEPVKEEVKKGQKTQSKKKIGGENKNSTLRKQSISVATNL